MLCFQFLNLFICSFSSMLVLEASLVEVAQALKVQGLWEKYLVDAFFELYFSRRDMNLSTLSLI